MRHIHVATVSSTNDLCKALLDTEDAIVVTADQQTAGRGQRGRRWESPPEGNLYCSLGFRHRPPITPGQTFAFLFLAALSLKAVAEYLLPHCPLLLKYPNDLYARVQRHWKKLAGILIEHTFAGNQCTATVIGIGVNVEQTTFPTALGEKATSFALLGAAVPRSRVLAALLFVFEQLRTQPSQQLFQWWKEELALEHLSLSLEAGTATVLEILPDATIRLGQQGKIREHHFHNASLVYDLDAAFQQRLKSASLTEKLIAREVLPVSGIETLPHTGHQ